MQSSLLTVPWFDSIEHGMVVQNPLPLLLAHDDALGADKRPAEPPRILVVEDDFLVAMQIEAALIDAGFDVVGVAASADEAIERATEHRPALVVMDIRLVGSRDGIDAALELYRDHNIRCIFATAHSDQASRRRADPAAPLGWLQKPYTMISLIEMVQKALDESTGNLR